MLNDKVDLLVMLFLFQLLQLCSNTTPSFFLPSQHKEEMSQGGVNECHAAVEDLHPSDIRLKGNKNSTDLKIRKNRSLGLQLMLYSTLG